MNNFEKAVKLMSGLFQAQSRDEAKLEYAMAILNEMAEEDIESAALLDREQKERRKRLATDALDALKRYIKQCLMIMMKLCVDMKDVNDLSRQKLARNTTRKSEVFDNQGFRFLIRDLPMLGFAPDGRTSRTSAGHHRRLK